MCHLIAFNLRAVGAFKFSSTLVKLLLILYVVYRENAGLAFHTAKPVSQHAHTMNIHYQSVGE
jgi:hypothetical protein